MNPAKNNMEVWRGNSFELELVSQIKIYKYVPAVNNSASDLARSHAENLAYYGFTYQYIDFASLYSAAELVVKRSWNKTTNLDEVPLLELTMANGGLSLTQNSVVITISSETTAGLTFDSGLYKLTLTAIADGAKDQLVYGDFAVKGARTV